MDSENIVKLTPATVHELVEAHRVASISKVAPGLRREERWPFPGTVEVWLPDDSYGERHILATLHNLSEHGLAMRTQLPVPTGTRVSLALHQPTASCYGRALVRHCTQAHAGYLVGVEFVFDEEGTPS